MPKAFRTCLSIATTGDHEFCRPSPLPRTQPQLHVVSDSRGRNCTGCAITLFFPICLRHSPYRKVHLISRGRNTAGSAVSLPHPVWTQGRHAAPSLNPGRGSITADVQVGFVDFGIFFESRGALPLKMHKCTSRALYKCTLRGTADSRGRRKFVIHGTPLL